MTMTASTEGTKTMLYTDERVREMHPRQQAVLLPIPAEYRDAIVGRAHLLQNTTPGCIFSQALSMAAADLARLGNDLDALEALDRRDNHAAMRSCGCGACTRDADRLTSKEVN